MTAVGLALVGLVAVPTMSSAALATADSGAIWDSEACTANALPANDDLSGPEVALPFSLNFYGTTYQSLWVNNNGNVTFDGPLGTYTPFGLLATGTPIIAPFFADVDTRPSGSGLTRYGYGQTSFDGRDAFCVNWVDVGYYAGHTDKLNSFQLLLVSRPDQGQGAFDIIFNYNKVQWETGDASGGFGGIGGVSARVGFSSGTATSGASTELPGSGASGAFLDSSASGLIHSRLGSTIDGRYLFRVRGSGVVADTYVALGDSFQSGEGVFAYEPGTDVGGTNLCHRSYASYPHLLVTDGSVRLALDDRACSGAVISNIVHGQWNEAAQIDAVGLDTRLVTIGIVGNDLGFPDTIKECVASNVISGIGPATGIWNATVGACKTLASGTVNSKLDSLAGGQIRTDLLNLYRLIRAKAPYARVIVVSYPKFFPDAGAWTGACNTLWSPDQRWINQLVSDVDDSIDTIARVAGFESVNIADVFADGHGICSDDPAMNGIMGLGDSESFHPNATGHRLIADAIEGRITAPIVPTFVIRPQQTVTKRFTVSGRTFSVNVTWPGSDVGSTLTSPSGKQYTRTDPLDSDHGNGPTYEYFTVPNPEPGDWTVSLYGADVDDQGEEVTLSTFDEQIPNLKPVAVVSMTGRGSTYTFNASTSRDPDGSIATYEWSFTDGQTATGPLVSHTFAAPGEHKAALIVTDDDGAEGFADSGTLTVTELPQADDATLYSATDLHLTNTVTSGPGGDVFVQGNVNCDSSATVGGDLVATGDVRLTNACHISGDVVAGGKVTMTSAAHIDGTLTSTGAVTLMRTNQIGGEVRAAAVRATDGSLLSALVADGRIGQVTVDTTIGAPVIDLPSAVPTEPSAYPASTWTTWKAWLNTTAISADAPAWSAGRTSSPGCILAPWASSVNTSTLSVTANTVVDARSTASGCSSVSIQQMNLRLSADMVLLADSAQVVNGLTVSSTDGAPHTLQILVPGAVGQDSGSIRVPNGITADPYSQVMLRAPGTVSLNGPASFIGGVMGGTVKLTGAVTMRPVL